MEKFLGDLRAWLQSEENFLELRLLVTDERDNMVRVGSSAEHSQVPSISISVPASYPDMRDGDEMFFFTEDERHARWVDELNQMGNKSLTSILGRVNECVLQSQEQEQEQEQGDVVHSWRAQRRQDEDGSSSSDEDEDEDEDEELELEMEMSGSDGEEEQREEPRGGGSSSGGGLGSEESRKMEEFRQRFSVGAASKSAAERIMADLMSLQRTDPQILGFEAEPCEDKLNLWHVRIFGFDKDDSLYEDMQWYERQCGKNYVLLEMQFPDEYPFAPPFIRVVEPRFSFHSGHVTMQLLTMSGWAPTNDIESTIVSIRSEINAGGGRLDRARAMQGYTLQEARSAFVRVAAQHGWQT